MRCRKLFIVSALRSGISLDSTNHSTGGSAIGYSWAKRRPRLKGSPGPVPTAQPAAVATRSAVRGPFL
jgi:hypothetical protein